MRASRIVHFLLPLAVVGGSITVGPSAVSAEEDEPVGVDDADIAVPLTAAEFAAQTDGLPPRPDVGSGDLRPADVQTTDATTSSAGTVVIDDFLYDDQVTRGRAADVCNRGLRRGTQWAYSEIVDRFGGTPGTMYSCRERWDAANNPDCNGTVANPVTNPNFTSTCWSNHAQGRALDVMVGRSGGGYNTARGRGIVNWLLASDQYGNQNAVARRLGVQQILYEDRCWNSDGDRGIKTWAAMRPCGIGHFDHVHVDLTVAGADGRVSYWGAAPRVIAKSNSTFHWDRESGNWMTRRFVNLRQDVTSAGRQPTGGDRLIAGDWDRDRRAVDDIITWDLDNGNWEARRMLGFGSALRNTGRWPRPYDQAVAGDFDSDGFTNDLFLFDTASGNWAFVSWSGFVPTVRNTGRYIAPFTEIVAADLDGNEFVNDLFVWNTGTGRWSSVQVTSFAPRTLVSGTVPRRWDRAYAGDFSAGGELDEMIFWDVATGEWILTSWSGHRFTAGPGGKFDRAITEMTVGDFDTDGRMDDLVVRIASNGRWAIHSFHRLRRTTVGVGNWESGWDMVLAGTWG